MRLVCKDYCSVSIPFLSIILERHKLAQIDWNADIGK